MSAGDIRSGFDEIRTIHDKGIGHKLEAVEAPCNNSKVLIVDKFHCWRNFYTCSYNNQLHTIVIG